MDYYFFRFEITHPSGSLMAVGSERAVVIVDRDEQRARARLLQMHPRAVVLSVKKQPFVIPDHRKVPGGPHRNPAAHGYHRSA